MDVRKIKTHPVSPLLVPLAYMADLNFSAEQCLKGTDLTFEQVASNQVRVDLRQESRFFRNLLELTGDSTIGLSIGQRYLMKHNGMFGYTILSAPTFMEAFAVATKYDWVSLSWQKMAFSATQTTATLFFVNELKLEGQALDFYCDRDIASAMQAFNELLGYKVPLIKVGFIHDGHQREEDYQRFFGCPAEFNCPANYITIDASLLELPLASRDLVTFDYLSQHCQAMLAKLKGSNLFTAQVQNILLQRVGSFPAIAEVAETLNLSERSLRRYLTEEGSNYKEILDGIRFALAKEFLSETNLPLKEITFRLGFSEPGNFTHSFKRWAGKSPSEFRAAFGLLSESS